MPLLGSSTMAMSFAGFAAQGVDDMRALTDQNLSDTKDHRSPLGLFAGSHAIFRVTRLPLDARLGVGGRDEPHLMAQLRGVSASEVRASAGFNHDNTKWRLAGERRYLIPLQLLAQNRTACAVSLKYPKHILRQVEPDTVNIQHDGPPL